MSRVFRMLVVQLCVSCAVTGCGGPSIQPLMPTPALYTEPGVSPLAHVPEDQRWKPRRVY